MDEEELQQASYERLVARCRKMKKPIPPFAVAKASLRGQQWTPREAQELKAMIDKKTV